MKKILFFVVLAITFSCRGQEKIILTTGDSLVGTISEIDDDHSRILNPDGSSVVILSNMIKKSEDISTEEWQKGYIVLKMQTDTLRGYLNIKISSFGYIKKVWFRKNINEKKGTLKIGGLLIPNDSLRYFGTSQKKYKYFNFTDDSIPTKRFSKSKNSLTGWVEIIEEGPINICKGFSLKEGYNNMVMMPTAGGETMMTGGGSGPTYTPMYCLKKGNKPTILIAAPTYSLIRGENIMLYEINDRNKEYFVQLISDYPELAEKIKSEKLLFWEIAKAVSEYNNWARNNNK